MLHFGLHDLDDPELLLRQPYRIAIPSGQAGTVGGRRRVQTQGRVDLLITGQIEYTMNRIGGRCIMTVEG